MHVKSKKFKQTKIKPTGNEVASTGYKWVEVAPLRRRPVCVRRETEEWPWRDPKESHRCSRGRGTGRPP